MSKVIYPVPLTGLTDKFAYSDGKGPCLHVTVIFRDPDKVELDLVFRMAVLAIFLHVNTSQLLAECHSPEKL